MDCCNINNKKVKKCVRKKDKKEFTFPRLISKEKCLESKKPIKGFTKRASCAPYRFCKNKRKTNQKQKGGNSSSKNIYGKPLKVCSTKPMTGFYRNGYCETGFSDSGTHTVCAKMDKNFLKYTASKGNDLSSVVNPGENWCLCEYRWNEAFKNNNAPFVFKKSTNFKTDKNIVKNILKSNKRILRKKRKKHTSKQL